MRTPHDRRGGRRGADLVAAIVLSCDAYHPLAEHMIRRYDLLWPNHPFMFRVPYQSEPSDASSLALRSASNVQLVRTPPDIKATVLSLLDGLPDNQWVYWCIDDKYVIDIDPTTMTSAIEWIPTLADEFKGVLLCRFRKLLSEAYLRPVRPLQSPWGESMLTRSTYHQFWMHSFLRVGFIRDLFVSFPDRVFSAKEMDVFTGQVDDVPDLLIPDESVLLVSERNHMVLGESTTAGRLTRNVVDSLNEVGLPIPSGFERSERSIVMGAPLEGAM